MKKNVTLTEDEIKAILAEKLEEKKRDKLAYSYEQKLQTIVDKLLADGLHIEYVYSTKSIRVF